MFATTSFTVADTFPTSHHLSQQQFLEKYGTDDTSRALIRFYFRRNKIFKLNTLIFGTAGLVAGIVFDRFIVNGTPARGGILVGLAIGITLGLFIYMCAIVTAFSVFYWVRFSRKNLLKQLRKYKSGKPLLKRISRSILFQKYLQEEENRQ